MTWFAQDVGALGVGKRAISPQALSGTTAANGTGIDRSGFDSVKILGSTGATTGTPSSFTVTYKLQDSSDNSTFTDVSGQSFTVTAADGENYLNVNLVGLQQYIRVVMTPAFTGGSSPTVLSQASVFLGGAAVLPASNA